MAVCEILVTTEDGQKVAGLIELDNGLIKPHPEDGYAMMLGNIIGEPCYVDMGEREVTSKENPEEWFAALPGKYNGSYLRAKIV